MKRKRKPGPLARHHAVLKVRRIATRAGRLDERGKLGDPTHWALRQARARALLMGCVPDDVDDATFEGLDTGRALAAFEDEDETLYRRAA